MNTVITLLVTSADKTLVDLKEGIKKEFHHCNATLSDRDKKLDIQIDSQDDKELIHLLKYYKSNISLFIGNTCKFGITYYHDNKDISSSISKEAMKLCSELNIDLEIEYKGNGKKKESMYSVTCFIASIITLICQVIFSVIIHRFLESEVHGSLFNYSNFIFCFVILVGLVITVIFHIKDSKALLSKLGFIISIVATVPIIVAIIVYLAPYIYMLKPQI